MSDSPIETLRFRASGGTRVAPAVTAHGLRALNVADTINVAKAKHSANPHLNESGKAAKIREDAAKVVLRLNLSRAGIARELANRKTERDALAKAVLSPFAGDALASEIRGAIKSLPLGEKVTLASKDPRVLAAISAAPEIVTGVPHDVQVHITNAYLNNNHAAEFERANKNDTDADEAFAVAAAALTVAEQTLYQAAGFQHNKAFEDWRYEVAKPTAAQLEAEAAGRAAPGTPSYSIGELMDVGMDSYLEGLPK